MKDQNAPRPWALAALLLAPLVPAVAQDDPVLRVKLEEPQPVNKNRFGLSYRMSFNIAAEFKNVGGVGSGGGGGARGPGPKTGAGIDRFYDDGYNRVDISGNKDGLTWFWGYRNSSQIQDDTVVMQSRVAKPIDASSRDDDPQHGMELTYNRELGVCQKTGWRWGVEAALGWTDIDIRDNRPLAGGVRIISDAYDLGGVDPQYNQIPPGSDTPPPVNVNGTPLNPGSYTGPGSLIDDSPDRSISSLRNGTRITGSRQFDADFWTYRLGPYVDMPIDDHWTFSFSAGAVVGVVDGEFSYRQTVATTGGSTRYQSGSGSNTDVVYGGYLSAVIRYAINENWGLFLGGQYLGLTSYDAKAGNQKIEIDFATTAHANMGVSFSF